MKFCPEICEAIIDYIKSGRTNDETASLVGISRETFYQWLREGREDTKNNIKSAKSDFSDDVKKAQVHFIASSEAVIRKASLRSWQAAAWLLERKFPDKYALKNRYELTGKDGQEIKIVTIPAMDKIMKTGNPE